MSESLKRRVEGSLYAVQLLSLIPSRDLEDADYMDGLVDRMIRDGSHAEIEDAAEAKPEPIARLGATVMPFGAHAGKTFDETPRAYLDWLCSSQESFYKSLRNYLRHPELESRRGSER